VSELGNLYDGMDQTSARQAQAALEWILPEGGGLSDLSQMSVQRFVWYFLPAKWLIDTSEHHEVASALGDLFAAAGLDRYAAICRDPVTHRVIDAYEESSEQGIKAYREASLDSGLEPPDTDVLAWGSVMGMQESRIQDDVSEMLEAAIVSGDLVVGDSKWKASASRLTADYLVSGRDGTTPAEVVRAERAAFWAGSGGQARRQILEPVLPLLALDVKVVESPEAVRALLEGVGEGVMLTQAGYLQKALAVELNDRFRWYDLPGYKVNSEADVSALMDLHELLRETRLLTKRGRKLTVSAEGRRCLADDERLVRRLAEHLFSGDDFAADMTVLKAAWLLANPGGTAEANLTDVVHQAAVEKWKTSTGESPLPDEVQYAGRWRWIAKTLGWLEEGGDRLSPWHKLTASGRAATVLGLRSLAHAPRHRL
jgi:hypothetical protein